MCFFVRNDFMKKTMRRSFLLLCGFSLMASTFIFQASAQQNPYIPVVLISIDGLKPDYVLEADKYNLQIPNLRKLVKEGAFATQVTGIMPTVTYPSHTTMVTGVSPAKHGIITNSPFDPFGKNQGGWNWYAEDIKVPTLWEVVGQAGMRTSSVDWPVTVGAKIQNNIVQIWRASTPEDHKLLRALSTKGLIDEAEKILGEYPYGYNYTIESDGQRAQFSAYILEKKKPHFHTAYFSVLDEEQHANGPYAKKVFETLEAVDAMIGKVWQGALKAGNGRAYICVVSDHGFSRIDKEIRLNFALREAGLLQLDEKGALKSWRAIAWISGGSTAVVLKDKGDDEARNKVRDLLSKLNTDASSGVLKFFEGEALQKTGGFPTAAFIVGAKPGYYFGGSFESPVLRARSIGGGHGFLPELAEMDSAFFIAGQGIGANRNLGRIDMRDIAPTLAALLKVKLPYAEGRDVLKQK
jgi:predicted AlkP superfamily pyrophosphatase or phosphodiesterase